MINYKIHYAPGRSPEERKALASRDFLAFHLDENLMPRPFIIFENILKEVTKSINQFLRVQPGSNGKLFVYGSYTSEAFTDLKGLLSIIIPKIDSLEKFIEGDATKPNINKEVIEAVERMQNYSDINPITLMKILVQYEVPGIKRIEFTGDNTGINQETLWDIGYPMEFVPKEYNCSILMTIMSDPCMATVTECVDRTVINNFPSNPFTRRPWPTEVATNGALLNEINSFVRKVEWLYHTFQDNQQYKDLYYDTRIQTLLSDPSMSYDDLRSNVNQYLKEEQSTKFVLVIDKKEAFYPPKYILDLFNQNAMHVLHPTKQDYEKLIRRLAVAGDVVGLERLLHSPALDSAKIDIYARNDKGQNVLDLLSSYRETHAELRHQYEQCAELLTKFQNPSSDDRPSAGRASTCRPS